MTTKLLATLKEAITASEQNSLFNSDAEGKLKQACVDYLRHYGFTVVVPKKFSNKVKNTRELVILFYQLLNAKHPGNFATSYNERKDMALAKRFVEGRMAATGASKEFTLDECGEIIKTIFDHEEIFNFKYEITFSIFGQDKLKWVTDRAIQIMNEQLKKEEEKKGKALQQKAVSMYEHEVGYSDLDDLLAKMEENN